MTFAEIRSRIFKYWWVVLTSTILVTLMFYPWVNALTYESSISLGMNFNSPSFSTTSLNSGDSSKSLAYVEMSIEFSKYLVARFGSVEIQSSIANAANIKQKSYNDKTPFYTVTPVAAGFVTVSYDGNSTKDQGTQFLSGVKGAYSQIINEWNVARLDEYKISAMDSFNEAVVETERPIQFQVLPIIIGWIVGLAIAVFIPQKKTNQ
jgi:hypothetical protein